MSEGTNVEIRLDVRAELTACVVMAAVGMASMLYAWFLDGVDKVLMATMFVASVATENAYFWFFHRNGTVSEVDVRERTIRFPRKSIGMTVGSVKVPLENVHHAVILSDCTVVINMVDGERFRFSTASIESSVALMNALDSMHVNCMTDFTFIP